MPGGYRSLSFQHFTALTIVLTLAATSSVSFSDTTFVVLSIPYLLLLSTITFPPPSSPPPPVFSAQERRILVFYVSVGGLVGLLLPLLQIIHSLVVGEFHAIAVPAPHLFLLSAQIFLEGVSFGYGFSLPARAAVPIIYNTKRLFTIADWVRHEVGGGVSVGLVIALANTVFWGFNLLGFLLPVYLPRALKLYYCDEGKGSKKSG
ncbi:transmembrane protein [Rhynchospora pubera]|uniref:Transmembrane protein n=1 Tax=Rhynchospora pubera TaxID=906938 RepID=A0AAV8E4L3_9POAL|nr:transmembrane protein [Rhynchospora pubera]